MPEKTHAHLFGVFDSAYITYGSVRKKSEFVGHNRTLVESINPFVPIISPGITILRVYGIKSIKKQSVTASCAESASA